MSRIRPDRQQASLFRSLDGTMELLNDGCLTVGEISKDSTEVSQGVVIDRMITPPRRLSFPPETPPFASDRLEEAGAVVKSARRTWQDWERGRLKMPAGLFDLFKLKRGLK